MHLDNLIKLWSIHAKTIGHEINIQNFKLDAVGWNKRNGINLNIFTVLLKYQEQLFKNHKT